MPELDPSDTNDDVEYDATTVGYEDDAEFENDDFENADRGDVVEAEIEEAPAEITEEEVAAIPEVDEEEDAQEEVQEEESQDEEVAVVEEEVEEVVEEEKPQSKQRIPKERFDEINERRKAAELHARELQAKLDAQESKPLEEEFDFDAKETEYMEHVLDGELEKARIVRSEIRSAEQRQYQAMTANVRDEAVEVTQARNEFMGVVTQLQADYAEFDPEGKDFDQGLVDEVLEMKDAFIAREGNVLSPGQALKKAASYVAKMNDLQTADYQPEPEAKVEPEVDLKKSVKKKATNVKEKVKQSNSQPPTMQAGETDHKGTPNIEDMDEDEFEALPEATKRRLRGDIM